MALKPDRIELPDGSRIKFFMNEVADRGIVVQYDAPGGQGMDDPNSTVSIPTGATGTGVSPIAGLLMNDVVNLNLTRQHKNWHKDEVQVGDKVDVLRRGVVRTDMLLTGDTPEAGEPAHFTVAGELTVTTTSEQIGRFVSEPDADGYVEVEINVV